MATEIVIDGRSISTFDEFVAQFNREFCGLFGPPEWDGEDFDALDDFLDSIAPLTIRWLNSDASRNAMGHEAMSEYLERRLAECKARFPKANYLHGELRQSIENAQANRGRTLFEYLCWQIDGPSCKVVPV